MTKNKKQLKKEEILIHLDYSVSDKCKNFTESYGEVCVKCGKCGRKFFGGVLAKSEKEAKNIINKITAHPPSFEGVGKG